MDGLAESFKVAEYSITNLIDCLADASGQTSREDIREKLHTSYFEEYFTVLQAATFIVEYEYIDRDYLEDHTAYYDRCFRFYGRHTRRLHFFSKSFTRKQFTRLLQEPSIEPGYTDLRESYLGFIVVKPLPQTIIGRTCLRTYDLNGERRHFPGLHTYCVNLYGLELTVRSLPYQEQDTVVAACATSALWSCFHGTGRLFQHKIPAPFEITKWAEDIIPDNPDVSARMFPNAGLTYAQMAYAIRRVGLEPFVDAVNRRHLLNATLYAYFQCKIPPILLTRLVECVNGRYSARGGHAITLTGYSIGEARATEYDRTGFLLRASRIDRVYGHDDQVGPFARMVWKKAISENAEEFHALEQGDGVEWLETTWRGKGTVYAVPDNILLPLYHKIRIPFMDIHNAMLALDLILENARKSCVSDLNRAEWDIFLTTGNDYKTAIRKDYEGSGVDIMPSLLKNLPRFLWRVMVRVNEELQLDFLFDATGIGRHDLLVHAASTGKGYAQLLHGIVCGAQSSLSDLSRLPMQARAVLNW
ncbi:MAG: hypothetical protein LBI68_08480, partial [Azoarcus sp.]|nr:hypothetical protein [Azoarcus sp.]